MSGPARSRQQSGLENNSVTMFPSLKDPEHANVRLKNVGRQVYLCVKHDDAGSPVLGTKTLSESVDPEGEYVLRASLITLCVYVQ
jgi:hypothetical protein